jgi:hypothetical protein
MTDLITELYEIAADSPYIPAARRIMVACDTRDWSAVTRAANEAMRDPMFMQGRLRSADLRAWSQRANRITLTAKARTAA